MFIYASYLRHVIYWSRSRKDIWPIEKILIGLRLAILIIHNMTWQFYNYYYKKYNNNSITTVFFFCKNFITIVKRGHKPWGWILHACYDDVDFK